MYWFVFICKLYVLCSFILCFKVVKTAHCCLYCTKNWLLINALSSTDSWPEGWCFTRCSISNLVYVGMLTTLEIIQKTWGCLSYLVLLLFVTLLSPCPVFCFFLLSFFPLIFPGMHHVGRQSTRTTSTLAMLWLLPPAPMTVSNRACPVTQTPFPLQTAVCMYFGFIQTFHTQLYQLKQAMQVTTFRGMTVLPSPIK